MAKKRIAVLFGGASADYSASLRTAYSVLSAMPKDEYEPLPIGITRAGRWLFYPGSYENIQDGSWEMDIDCCSCILSPDALTKGAIKIMSDGQTSIVRIDAVFPLLHGKYGEDGRIQGLCKLTSVPIIGNDLAAANVCLDRKLTNLLLKDAGLNVAEYITLDRSMINDMDLITEKVRTTLGFPVYAIPSNCSSAIGAYKAENEEQLSEAVKTAFSHHSTVIVEKKLTGRSIECAVLSSKLLNDRLAVGESVKCCDASESAYYTGSYELKVPAELDEDTLRKVKETAAAAFKALSCKAFARIDMVLTDDKIIVRRVRGIPGLGRNSIIARLASAGGISYEQLLEQIISSAIDSR